MGFRYRLASTPHDAYSDLGPSHLLIIRILAARRFDFNNVHFFASASATASTILTLSIKRDSAAAGVRGFP